MRIRSIDHAALLIALLVTLVVIVAGSVVIAVYHFFWWGLAAICVPTFIITYLFTRAVIKWGSLIETATAEISSEVERLAEIDYYRREYLGNFAHEIKTPVFNAQGYISTLLDGAMDDEKVRRLYLERAEKSIERIIDIVDFLDEISRLESGDLDLEYGRFDVVALAREIADTLEMDARAMKIRIAVEAPSDACLGSKNSSGVGEGSVGGAVADAGSAIFVVADRKYVAQVLVNLISNSIKYGTQGGWTRVSFAPQGDDKVAVSVADNGEGIEKEDMPRVFDRFFRTDASRSREKGGTGLGLAIVKHIVEAHGESISLDSELGVGSTFSFTLSKI